MRLKALVASALLGSTLVSSLSIPMYSYSSEVSASTININYAAASSVNMDGIKAFVTRMYDVCLSRTPDTEGLNGWANQLANKEATGCSVAYGFVFSPEFVNKKPTNTEFVKYMYDAFFGRTPDDAGLKYWVDSLNSGASKESVFSGFANSQEFSNLCSKYGVVRGYHIEGYNHNQIAKVNLFVERLYNVILDRTCDEGGMAGWTTKLVSHEQTGCSAAYGFAFSPEFLNKNACNNCYVDVLYSAFLGRTPDADGKKAWVNKLASGASRETVFGGFAGSLEFANICADYGIEPGNLNGITSSTYGGGKCSICGTSEASTSTTNPTSTPVGSSDTGLVVVNGDQYYYENGKMAHGWVPLESPYRLYYFDDTTGKALHGWQTIEDKKYYFLDSGIAASGFYKVDGKTYYFDTTLGIMRTGWLDIKEDSTTYYFDKDTGVMHTGWLTIYDEIAEKNIKYYFTDSGKMETGFQMINNEKYYFSKTGMLDTGWLYLDSGTYYADDNGAIVTGWKELKASYDTKAYWFYFDKDGVMLTDWQKIGGVWYHFTTTGRMDTGWITDNGKQYYLGTNGKMCTGWIKTDRHNSGQESWYYFEASGALQTGWQKIGDNWFYFDTYGRMQTGWQLIKGEYYWFGNDPDDGKMKTGWKEVTDAAGKTFWCYFQTTDKDLGKAYRSGVYKINDKWYYFSTQGVLYTDAKMSINGKVYTIDSNGVVQGYSA